VNSAVLLQLGRALPSPNIDPDNVGGWVLFEDLSDEFDGLELNASKWQVADGLAEHPAGGWRGRQPGLFHPSNVRVADGQLQLWANQAHRDESWPSGYDNFTTSYVQSMALTAHGIFELRWRSASSGISSSWWFHTNDGKGTWTELDVFESTGVQGISGMDGHQVVSHQHVFGLKDTGTDALPAKCNCELSSDRQHCSSGAQYAAPFALSDDYHIMSLNWTEARFEVYLDGKLVNAVDSPCLQQPIGMNFDRETMPGWMAIPDPSILPDRPFVIDYVRTWKRGPSQWIV
jgi:beta-glucanase (GH16 family)